MISSNREKPDLHPHPGFPDHVGISQPVVFFCGSEYPLYRLFPLLIKLLHSDGMPDVLTQLHIVFPYVPHYDLLIAAALCALRKIRAAAAFQGFWLVLPITFPVCRSVFQCPVRRADVTVIHFIVYVFVFQEETFFRHRTKAKKEGGLSTKKTLYGLDYRVSAGLTSVLTCRYKAVKPVKGQSDFSSQKEDRTRLFLSFLSGSRGAVVFAADGLTTGEMFGCISQSLDLHSLVWYSFSLFWLKIRHFSAWIGDITGKCWNALPCSRGRRGSANE